VARETRKALGASPSLRPKATASAARRGSGSRSSTSSSGAHSWCSPANGSCVSCSAPAARTMRQSAGVVGEVVEQHGLADAALAADDERAAVIVPRSVDQQLQGRTLASPPKQRHRHHPLIRPTINPEACPSGAAASSARGQPSPVIRKID